MISEGAGASVLDGYEKRFASNEEIVYEPEDTRLLESQIKECPVCHARCFADMDTCYGCLYSFADASKQEPNRAACLQVDEQSHRTDYKEKLNQIDQVQIDLKKADQDREKSLSQKQSKNQESPQSAMTDESEIPQGEHKIYGPHGSESRNLDENILLNREVVLSREQILSSNPASEKQLCEIVISLRLL